MLLLIYFRYSWNVITKRAPFSLQEKRAQEVEGEVSWQVPGVDLSTIDRAFSAIFCSLCWIPVVSTTKLLAIITTGMWTGETAGCSLDCCDYIWNFSLFSLKRGSLTFCQLPAFKEPTLMVAQVTTRGQLLIIWKHFRWKNWFFFLFF